MTPVISVVVPAYNEEKLIGRCLDSLMDQDFNLDYEVILVNNNSTDCTVEIAKKYNVKIVDETKKGVIFAKQRGYLTSKGQLVAFLDADCIAPRNWLTVIHSSFTTPEVVAVTGPYTLYDGPRFHRQYAKIVQSFVNFSYKHFKKNVYLAGGNCAYRKKILDKFCCFDTTKGVGEDEFGILAKVKKHGKVVYNPMMKIRTSGRRASGGLFNFVSQMLVRYSLNYLSVRIIGKNIFPPYNDFR